MAKRGSLDQDRIVRIQEFTTRDCLEIVKRSADILHVEDIRNLRFESELINIIISPDFSYNFYALIHSMIME